MTELTPAQRRDLRARAHHLNPVVTIGDNGLAPTVVAEIERSLQAPKKRSGRQVLAAAGRYLRYSAPSHRGVVQVMFRSQPVRKEIVTSDDGSNNKDNNDELKFLS